MQKRRNTLKRETKLYEAGLRLRRFSQQVEWCDQYVAVKRYRKRLVKKNENNFI
jgi:hypothetical protein